ncbi:MAG: hypothetical protein QM790_04020 [Nibricoccus sp.]
MPAKQKTVVALARTGGVAGIRPPPSLLDTAKASAEICKRVEELLTAAEFFSLPEELPAKRAADAFQYTLSVQHETGKKHAVTFCESTASEALRELKRLVRDHAQAPR